MSRCRTSFTVLLCLAAIGSTLIAGAIDTNDCMRCDASAIQTCLATLI